MSKRPTIEIWMPLHFADITKACSRMSELEECVFIRLLRDAWLNGPARDDDKTLQKIARISRAKWIKIRGVIEPHFDRAAGLWVHFPTEERRQQALRVSAARTDAVNSRSDRQNDAEAKATIVAIRDLSSISPISVVNPLPIQEGSTDSQVISSAAVVPFVRRADHA